MKCNTVQILWHRGEPVFSVDFHTADSIITGGGDGELKYWQIVTRSKADGYQELSVDFISGSNAFGTGKNINCVRVSPTGDFLATGGDKGEVLLWRFQQQSPPAAATGNAPPPSASSASPAPQGSASHSVASTSGGIQLLSDEEEKGAAPSWRPAGQFRGHVEDVQDICWSPDGTALASGGIDNECIVWDVATRRAQARLTGHSHYIQGVCWDPLGWMLMTQSADRTARLFGVMSPGAAVLSQLLKTAPPPAVVSMIRQQQEEQQEGQAPQQLQLKQEASLLSSRTGRSRMEDAGAAGQSPGKAKRSAVPLNGDRAPGRDAAAGESAVHSSPDVAVVDLRSAATTTTAPDANPVLDLTSCDDNNGLNSLSQVLYDPGAAKGRGMVSPAASDAALHESKSSHVPPPSALPKAASEAVETSSSGAGSRAGTGKLLLASLSSANVAASACSGSVPIARGGAASVPNDVVPQGRGPRHPLSTASLSLPLPTSSFFAKDMQPLAVISKAPLFKSLPGQEITTGPAGVPLQEATEDAGVQASRKTTRKGGKFALFMDEIVLGSFFRRPAWSPDGYLVCLVASVMKQSKAEPEQGTKGETTSGSRSKEAADQSLPCTLLFRRGEWDRPCLALPTVSPSQGSLVAKWCPVIFFRREEEPAQQLVWRRGKGRGQARTHAGPPPASYEGLDSHANSLERREAAGSGVPSTSAASAAGEKDKVLFSDDRKNEQGRKDQRAPPPTGASEDSEEGFGRPAKKPRREAEAAVRIPLPSLPQEGKCRATPRRGPFPELGYRMVLAVASAGTVTLYDTEKSKPLVVLGGIHYAYVTDLAWSPDGRSLAVSSRDGYVTLARFEKDELGVPVPLELLPAPVAASVSKEPAAAIAERAKLISATMAAKAAQRQAVAAAKLAVAKSAAAVQPTPAPEFGTATGGATTTGEATGAFEAEDDDIEITYPKPAPGSVSTEEAELKPTPAPVLAPGPSGAVHNHVLSGSSSAPDLTTSNGVSGSGVTAQTQSGAAGSTPNPPNRSAARRIQPTFIRQV